MMLEKLRKEWEKHFAKNHNLEELKNRPTNNNGQFIQEDGQVIEVWEHPNVDALNQMITKDWERFLTESNIYQQLSEEEQIELKVNGPSYSDYSGD